MDDTMDKKKLINEACLREYCLKQFFMFKACEKRVLEATEPVDGDCGPWLNDLVECVDKHSAGQVMAAMDWKLPAEE
ncbi:MAG: hypothetical protein MHM6MM_000440 [Cercozoa sp. M6MM]